MRTIMTGFWVLLLVLCTAVGATIGILTHRSEGRYFDADGIRLHYTVEGQGEPVVLLHGFAVNADLNWRLTGITAALARHFQVITLDLRGHGLSDKPHDPGSYGAAMLHDVLRLLDHLKIGKAHLVGYSLGGFIALKMAAEYPQRLLTVAVLGAGWERPDNPMFLSRLAQLADALQAGEAIGPLCAQLGAERPKPGWLHTWAVRLMTGYFNDQQALAALVRSLGELALTEVQLRRIPIPIRMIVGSLDPFRISAQAGQGLIPDYTLVVIDGADHLGASLRRETIQALGSFLRQRTL